jgi:hypothetical protein
MSGRDRLVAIVVGSLVVLAAVWLLLVSPERQKAAKLDAQVSAASAQLAAAEGQVASARTAQASYANAYATIVRLGKAVPSGEEVPSLIYELSQASNHKNVDFSSIVASSGSGSNSAAASAASAASAAATTGGLTMMPFTFVFNGSYLDLYHLFQQLNRFTMRTASGGLQVSGRLLTIQSVKLAPLAGAAAESPSAKNADELSGTITASAYVLPAAQGLTAGATPASPGAATSTVASTAPAASSATAPAVVRVSP